jgi:hypothetical protein
MEIIIIAINPNKPPQYTMVVIMYNSPPQLQLQHIIIGWTTLGLLATAVAGYYYIVLWS